MDACGILFRLKVVIFSCDDAHGQLMKVQLQFTTVVPKLNQGEFRKPGCILVFGVLFAYFLDKQKVKEKSPNQLRHPSFPSS